MFERPLGFAQLALVPQPPRWCALKANPIGQFFSMVSRPLLGRRLSQPSPCPAPVPAFPGVIEISDDEAAVEEGIEGGEGSNGSSTSSD